MFLRDRAISPTPVKIAVLDTGTYDPKDLRLVYHGRLKECRGWRDSRNSENGVDMPNGGDQDGHGTHVTSLLLDITQGLECEVFVAQVFGDRHEKQSSQSNQRVQRSISQVSTPEILALDFVSC